LGGERVLTQRTLTHLQGLQTGCDEWLLIAKAGEMTGLSPFVLAAPRLVLLVDAHPMSVTTAWASLKRILRAAPQMGFAICHAGEHDQQSLTVLSSFCSLAASRFGVRIEQVGSLGEALVTGPEAKGAAGFMQRLLQLCCSPVNRPESPRFPGSPVYVRLSVP
jgi:hypothetical protein